MRAGSFLPLVFIALFACSDIDGNWAVENEGVPPDIEVEMTPKDVIAGHDPQLERAVQEALRLLETQRFERKTEPPRPVRTRRAGGGG